jgi:apolipoprotein N-acyltransferase
VSLAPLIVAVVLTSRATATARWRGPFVLGVLAGVIYFAGTLYWIANVMAQHGGLPFALAAALMVGLAVHLSLFVGLFAWMLSRAVRAFGPGGVWFAPLLWVAAEWLRAWFGWDFPWVLLGSSQASVIPVVQLASLTGVYGLSALVALVATAAAALALSRRRGHVLGAAATLLLLTGLAAWGSWRAGANALGQSGTPIRIGLLQGNIPQEEKDDPAYRDAIMARYIDLSRQALGAGAQLVIWPEASTPFFFDLDAAGAAPVRRLASEARVPFIVGSDELERNADGTAARYFNAAMLVGSDGRTRESYRKIRLVPFGEYVPFKRILFFVGPLVEAVADFSAGDEFKVFNVEGSAVSVAICYEAVYGRIAQAFVERGSQLLATITNDAWFGRSSAAYQHFDQAALRAVEQGRYLVRAANTGITGAVDPYGRVLADTALFEPAMLAVDVRLLSGRTIYHAVGDLVAWLSLLASAAVVVRSRLKRAS